MVKQSFPPVLPTLPRILILGSLPGDLSLAQQQYYAHPQNRFWKVLFRLFEKDFSPDYDARIRLLHTHGIALWDVCASAIRPGSMDTAITDVIPNAIDRLLTENPSIQSVFFNGQKAQKLFDKHFHKEEHLHYITLPSTSPANAQFSLDRLIQHWQIIKG